MSGDKFDQLYNALKADGAVSGTREHFRQFVYAPGKQGYQNRKQLYDALHADGAVSSKSYEEFAKRLGLHAVKPQSGAKPVVEQTQQSQQSQKAQQPTTAAQKAIQVMDKYQKSVQPQQQQPTTATVVTDYMGNWNLMNKRENQMTPTERVQAGNMRSRMQKAQEQALRQEQQRENPITQSKAMPSAKSYNQTIQELTSPEAKKARAKQQREDDARNLAQYEVENNRFVHDNGKFNTISPDIDSLVEPSMKQADDLSWKQYQQDLKKAGGDAYLRRKAWKDLQDNRINNRQNVLAENLSAKLLEIYSQRGLQEHIFESADKLNMGVEEYLNKYVTPQMMQRAQNVLGIKNIEELLPKGATEYVTRRLSDSILGTLSAGQDKSKDQIIREQQAMAIADGLDGMPTVKGYKGEKGYKSGVGARFVSTAANMTMDSPVLGMTGAAADFTVNAGKQLLLRGLSKAGVVKMGAKLTTQQMAFKVANMTMAQKIASGLLEGSAKGALNLGGYSSITSALGQASTGDDTSLSALGSAALEGFKHGSFTGAMFGVSGAIMAPWVSKFGINGLETSAGEKWLHGAQKFGATAAGLGVEAGTMMVADNITGDKDISIGTWLEDLVMVGAFKAGEPKNYAHIGRALYGLTHNTNNTFRVGKDNDGNWRTVDIRMTKDEQGELINSVSGKNLMDAFVKVDKSSLNSKTPLDKSITKQAYQDFMNDPNVSQSTKEKVNAAMGLFNTTSKRSYRSVNDVKNKQILEYDKNGTLLTRTSYKNADERRAILYKQKMNRDNDEMLSLMGLARTRDLMITDGSGNATFLVRTFLERKGYNEEAGEGDPNNAMLISGLKDKNSGIYNEWVKYAERYGVLGTINSINAVASDSFSRSLFIKNDGEIDLKTIMRKDPMKRTDVENEIFYKVKAELEEELFPSGKPHEEQSEKQGTSVAEDNNLGTDQPNSEVVKQELGNLSAAEAEMDELIKGNDVFGQSFKNLQDQGLTNPQIYDWMIQEGGLTEETLAPFAHYINANARVQGMQEATMQKIEEVVSSTVQDWSYHGSLNGQDVNGEQVIYVQDRQGRMLIVGSGDASFDPTTGRAKEDVGDMLVCLDPNTKEMAYVKVDEVTFFQTQSPEDFANEHRQRLQDVNNQPYNEAAQEQAAGAAKPQQEEVGTNKEGTTNQGEFVPQKGENDTINEKDDTISTIKEDRKQPQPTRKFADGTDVPMTTDSKGRPTPDYGQMKPEQAAEILAEDFGENAEKVVDGQVKKAEKALKDAEKMKVDYSAELNDIKEQEQMKAQTVEAAKKQLEQAQNIKKAMTAKKVAETMGKPSEGEKVEGAHEADSVAAQKFQNAPRLQGNHVSKRLPNGEKISGHYEIVPAESLTPSHDAMNGYKMSEGFPVDSEGRTINDRDYEHDKAAQQTTDQMAQKYSGQAITQVPTVSDEGIVYDGNGRTMAGQKAAKNGTDGEYIEDLMDNAQNYGFTREQIEQSGIEHPRLVMVTDERLPYDTATFSKFNRNEKKAQSNTEQAVAKAKTLTSDEVGVIVADIEGNGSLDAFFNNSKAINDLVKTLVDKGVIGQNEVAGFMDGPERLSAQGKEYVKNLLLGSIFKPETIRMLGYDPIVKNKAIAAVRSVMDNMKLGDFSLRDEIDQAVQLFYEARRGKNNVDTLLRTEDMFYGNAADRYSPISQMMALALEGKVSDFRDLLDEYNRLAKERNTGEGNMFGDAPTKEELVKEYLDFKNWKDYGTRHSETEGNIDVPGTEKPKQEAPREAEPQVKVNRALKKIAIEITKQTGIEVVTDKEVGQSTLEDAEATGSNVKYSRVTDEGLIEQLDKEPKVKVYRAMQVIDGKLYPPMAAYADGKLVEANELGTWIQADEMPDSKNTGYKIKGSPAVISKDRAVKGEDGVWRDSKTGKELAVGEDGEPTWYFNLQKGKGADGKKLTDVGAAYNPYWHLSHSPLNDQFKSAWIRPNIVIVECEVPESELSSGYRAEHAKNSVGMTPWTSGVVTKQLVAQGHEGRKVVLSRWCKPVRVVPDTEVAAKIKEFIGDYDVAIPENVVTPKQKVELEKLGVKIGAPEKGMNKNEQIADAIKMGLQVDNTVKEFRSANGEIYGYTVGGKIYLDTKKMKPETPLHEYTHLWTEALRNTNPTEWENVKKLFDEVEGLKEEVQKLYPELKGDDLYEEMITTFSGREGAKKLEETVRGIAAEEGKTVEESVKAKSFLDKVKEALQKYWNGVADMLHIHFTSAEEVADKVLADWASGVNPKENEEPSVLERKQTILDKINSGTIKRKDDAWSLLAEVERLRADYYSFPYEDFAGIDKTKSATIDTILNKYAKNILDNITDKPIPAATEKQMKFLKILTGEDFMWEAALKDMIPNKWQASWLISSMKALENENLLSMHPSEIEYRDNQIRKGIDLVRKYNGAKPYDWESISLLSKEKKPDPKFDPIGAAAENYKKDHPMTEDEIMAVEGLDDESKYTAIDYLNGEDDSEIARICYEQAYKNRPSRSGRVSEEETFHNEEVQSHDWSNYKPGDIFDFEGFKVKYITTEKDEKGNVIGVVVQHLDENGKPIENGRESVPPLMFMENYKKEPSADPMEGIKNAAEGFEKEKVEKSEKQKTATQKVMDVINAANKKAKSAAQKKAEAKKLKEEKDKETADLMQQFLDAANDRKNDGSGKLFAAPLPIPSKAVKWMERNLTLSDKQKEILPKLLTAIKGSMYARIKEGVYNLEDVIENIRKDFKPFFGAISKDDANKILAEAAYKGRYTDPETGERMKLSEYAERERKNTPEHKAKLEGDSKEAEERKQKEASFINKVKAVLSLGGFKNGIVGLRKIAESCGLKDVKDTDLQELAETAIVGKAREISTSAATSPEKKFELIKKLYENQPSLNQRDSERVAKQQYSTPAPYAFLADMYVKGNGKEVKSALEPSAGNGMLTIGLPLDVVHVNDIDSQRLANLRRQGFKNVTSQDATQPFADKDVDIVVTNPPFGRAEPKEYDGYRISSLEGQMAINALESMKDDGRAAIIIGGKTEYAKNGSLNPKDKAFLGYLYSHYNVEDVINVDGSLYAKQGTSYPTRIILINGRRYDENAYPPVKDKARAETVKDYDELYKRISDDILRGKRMDSSIGKEKGSVGPELNRPSSTDTHEEGLRGGDQRGNQLEVGDGSEGLHSESSVSGATDDLANQRGTELGEDGGLPGGANGTDGAGAKPSQSNGAEAGANTGGRVLESGGNGRANFKPNVDGATDTRGGERPRGQLQRMDKSVRELSTEKVTYAPKSENPFTLKAVMPADQQDAVEKNLKKLGDSDQFLVDELGYNDKDDLYSHLAAEQVDSVALALQQAKNGNAFIIGDQTGIGKGRQAASLIRYAKKQGQVPIYFTKTAGLLSDVYRDLVDIGSPELRPFVFGSAKEAAITNSEGEVVFQLPSKNEVKRVLDYIDKNGKLPEEYDYVLTTYSQVSNGVYEFDENGNRNEKKLAKGKSFGAAALGGQRRRDAIEKLVGNGYLILDESHTAGGNSGQGNYFQHIIQKAKNVTFFSATFAKRPDNMPIYALRTAMNQGGMKSADLIEAVKRGGATLQEIMSKTLTECGQMIRRERDMTGVTIDWKAIDDPDKVKEQREQYDSIIGLFNDIINFQKTYVSAYVSKTNEEIASVQAAIGIKRGTEALGIKNVPFASKAFNTVQQVLLSLKAKSAAERAIDYLKQGMKPVIALNNTNESQTDNIAIGEEMDAPDLGTSLRKGLEGTLRYTTKNAKDESNSGYIRLEDLGDDAINAYHELERKIKEASTGLSLSPIDVIKNELEKAGYKVGELTGRSTEFIYNENGTVTKMKRTDTDKKKLAREFNDGQIDALILNKSAATGISLHASSKYGDQRKRVMIVAQQQLDVNDEVQMRGRIDRTGQVARGAYEYVVSLIPAEQRLLMMFKAKLKSLDANTTSSQKSKFNEMEVADITNKYGDKVVREYMAEHLDLYSRMADPFGWENIYGEDIAAIDPQKLVTIRTEGMNGGGEAGADASKALGRMALLRVEEQEKMLNEIGELYANEIQRLNEMGENDLEITELPLKAKTISKEIWKEGAEPGGDNAFADNTYIEKVNMAILKKPMKAEEVGRAQEGLTGGKSWDEYKAEKKSAVKAYFDEKAVSESQRYEERAVKAATKAKEKYLRDAKKGQKDSGMSDEQIEKNSQYQYENIYKQEKEKLGDVLKNLKSKAEPFERVFDTFNTEDVYVLPVDMSNVNELSGFGNSYGRLIDIKITDNFSPNASTVSFATLDGRRKITFPVAGFVGIGDDRADVVAAIDRMTRQASSMGDKNLRVLTMDRANWDRLVSNESRKDGYIVTGNLMQALIDSKNQGVGGQLVKYTTDTGEVKTGILMPDRFKPTDVSNEYPISTAVNKLELPFNKGGVEEVVSSDGSVKINFAFLHGDTYYQLRVPKSKVKGGKFFLDKDLLSMVRGKNFETRGSYMLAEFDENQLRPVLTRLSNLGVKVRKERKPVNGGTHFRTDRSVEYSKTDTKDVKNSRIIPEDVDKTVSSQIEKKFDDEVARFYGKARLHGKDVPFKKWLDETANYYYTVQYIDTHDYDKDGKPIKDYNGLASFIYKWSNELNKIENEYDIRRSDNIWRVEQRVRKGESLSEAIRNARLEALGMQVPGMGIPGNDGRRVEGKTGGTGKSLDRTDKDSALSILEDYRGKAIALAAAERAESYLIRRLSDLQIKYGLEIGKWVTKEQVEKIFYDNNSDSAVKEIFDRIKYQVEELGTKLKGEVIKKHDTMGFYDHDGNYIAIDTDFLSSLLFDKQSLASAICHEMLHVVTSDIIAMHQRGYDNLLSESQIEAAEEAVNMYSEIKDYYDRNNIEMPYALTKPTEMITELSSPEWRKALGKIPVAKGLKGKLINWVRKLIGLNPRRTALDNLNETLDKLLNNFGKEQFDFASKHTKELFGEQDKLADHPVSYHISDLSKKVGGKVNMVSSVDEITNKRAKEAIENGEKVTGWYDEKTGEVHLYMPNIHDRYTAEKTIWHEVVGHKGMRELLGEKGFNQLLREVWDNLDKPEYTDLKKLVDEERKYNPLDVFNAIEEGIARLAEEGKGEAGLWNNIKNKVTDFLHEIGYRVAPNTKDVKYLLWLSKNLQKNPNDPIWKMRAEAVKYRLSKENVSAVVERGGMFRDNDGKTHDMENLNKADWNEATDGEVHFRTTPSAGTAIDRYHRALDSHGYMFTESYMDNMLSLKNLMTAIAPGRKIENIASSENPYILQNTMQGAMSNAAQLFERNVMKPLDKAMAGVLDAFEGKKDEEKIRNFNIYMIKKHGLERNRVLFVRDHISGLDKADADALQNDWNIVKKDLGDKLRNGSIDLRNYYDQMDEWIRNNADSSFDAGENDYSGLHGIYGIDKSDPYNDADVISDVMDSEANMESINSGSVNDFWDKVKSATQFSLDYEYNNSLQTKDVHDHVTNMFDWYVPLRKFDETTAEDTYGYITEKGDPSKFIGSTLMTARGRTSLSETNILAQIGAMGNAAIKRSGDNAVKVAFARFVRNNGGQGLVTETKVWVEKTGVDVNGKEIWEEAYPQIPDDATPDEISKIVSDFETDMMAKEAIGNAKNLSKRGNIGFKFQRAKNKSQHIVDVKIAGKQHSFIINGNPRAAQALNGMLEHKNETGVGKILGSVSRFMAQTCTSYNPEFVMRNMIRDFEFASSNLLAKEGARYTASFEKYYAKVGLIEGIRNSKISDFKDSAGFGLFRKYRNGTLDTNDKVQRYFKEFMDNGGETGWVQVKNMKDLTNEYKRNVKTERNKVSKVGKGFYDAIFKNLENVNEVAENMARFATYCASRDAGRSMIRSAYDAKEVSTNFNRHGSGSEIRSFKNGEMGGFQRFRKQSYRFTSAWFRNTSMFFNAGIQSTNLLVKNIKNNPIGTAGYIVAGPMMSGMAIALLNNFLIANEDDKDRNGVKDPYGELPDYIRRNNLCVYIGGGEFVTIPLAIEERAFYGLGDLVAGLTFSPNVSGQKNPWMDGVGCVSQLVPVADYLGNSSFGKHPIQETVKAAAPSALSPLLEWFYNSDWKGAPIERDDKFNENQPAWMLAYKGTPEFLINLNKKANAWTNDVAPGNESMKGNDLLDAVTNPSGVQHFYSSYLGGAATFAERTLGLIKHRTDTETKDIPFLRSLLYTPSERTSLQRTKSKWYNYKDEMTKTMANVNGLKSKNVPVDERIRNIGDYYRFQNSKDAVKVRVIDLAEKQMKKWKKMRDKSTDTQSIKFANENIDRIMMQAVEQLDRLEE